MSDEDSAYWNLNAITCAFCLGDADRVVGAFLGHYKRAFRTGHVADRFVELDVHYADVVTHLGDAVADVLGSPRLPQTAPQYIGGGDDAGMWIETLPVAWVERIASVPTGQAPSVIKRWMLLSQEGFEANPEPWESPALLGSLRELIDIAAESVARGRPLLGLSAI
jgi:hypothetical protein